MQYRIIVILTVFLLCDLISAQTVFLSGNICANNQPWKLIFNDEFNGTSLNTNKWYTFYPHWPDQTDSDVWSRTHSDPNDEDKQEDQVYKDTNVVVSNGTVKLIAKKEASTWMGYNTNHSSGMLNSKGGFRYGKFVMRAKFPAGRGFWPAFWLWGNYDGVDEGADEIDIAEFNGRWTSNMFHVVHWNAPCGAQSCDNKSNSNLFDYTSDFHIYSVEWNEDFLVWKIDGIIVKQMARYISIVGQNGVLNCTVPTAYYTISEKYPDVYMNIIAGLGIIKNDGDGSFSGTPDATTVFPNQFEIDYIRVYQQDIQPGYADLCADNVILGNSNICTTNNHTYIYEGINTNPLWSVSSNLQIVSSSNTSITVKRLASSGNAWISANFSGDQPCATSLTRNITLGGGTTGDFNVIQQLDTCIPSTHPYARFTTNSSTSVTWSVSPSATCISCGSSMAIVRPNSIGGYTVTASKTYTNGCGQTSVVTRSASGYATACGTQRIIASPNPTNGNVRFDLENIQTNDIYRAEVRSLVGNSIHTLPIADGEETTIINTDLSHLDKGVYYLLVQLNSGQIITNLFTIIK